MQGFGADQTRVWTFALTEFVPMAGAMFIINDIWEACSTHYTGNLLLDPVFRGLLLRLSAKNLDVLVYFGLYKFTLRMKTDTVLTALAFKQHMDAD